MTDRDTPHDPAPAPLHAGELELQQRAGVRERIDRVARVVIRDHMPDQHREFFALLPTVLVAAMDENGQPWATMLCGDAGFMHAPDARHLHIGALPNPDDPLANALAPGASVGLLGLQPHTRRRNRMNGVVTARDASGFTVAVRQSFGNCPKYIQARAPRSISALAAPGAGSVLDGGPRLAPALIERVHRADTFFVASRSTRPDTGAPGEGLDVSHRGGRPGFVRVDQTDHHSVLTIPDFTGNFLFNTLGNLLQHPACALLFVDYDDGSLLHLCGTAEILWRGEEIARYAGAERLWRVHVERTRLRSRALTVAWSEPEFARELAPDGAWRP